MTNNRFFAIKTVQEKTRYTFSARQPLLTMSNKAVKLHLSQYVMQTFWNKIMPLPDSILSEIFSADFVTLWHGYAIPLRAADARSPGLSWQMTPIVLCLMGSFVQPDWPWSLCGLQHCRSAEAAYSSAFPHAVRRRNYSAGWKDLALRDKSLPCPKPDTSDDVRAPHAYLICRKTSFSAAFSAGIETSCLGSRWDQPRWSCGRKARWSEKALVSTLLSKYSASLKMCSFPTVGSLLPVMGPHDYHFAGPT